MSMIENQVKELREIAKTFSEWEYNRFYNEISEAVDTIEALSAKMAVENMERSDRYYGGGWIACGDRLPEEKINPVTKDFYEYQTTFQSEDVMDVRHYKFGNGHWWNGPSIMDEHVTAWRLPIEPYRP